MKNKKLLASLSIILPTLSYIICSRIVDDSVKGILICFIVALIFSIIGVILGFVTKKDAKIVSIVGIVVSFILIFACLAGIVGAYYISNLSNCVRTQNDTTTCEFNGVEINDIPTDILSDDQYKES